MSTVKSYSDFNGETVELCRVTCMKNDEFLAKFPGVKGRKYDSFNMFVGERIGTTPVWKDESLTGGPVGFVRDTLPVTRMVTYKSNPSKHVCDARCVNARGRTMNCECSCGGKNHGKGAFACN